MNLPEKHAIAEQIVTEILNDLCDRRGLKQAWQSIDHEIQTEIRSNWECLIVEKMSFGPDRCPECDRSKSA